MAQIMAPAKVAHGTSGEFLAAWQVLSGGCAFLRLPSAAWTPLGPLSHSSGIAKTPKKHHAIRQIGYNAGIQQPTRA
jgi:hypothetical protein